MLNDSVSPLFRLTFCCKVVKVAMVPLVLVKRRGEAKQPLQSDLAIDEDLCADTGQVGGRDSRSLQRREHIVQARIQAGLHVDRKHRLIGLQIRAIGSADRNRIRIQLPERERSKMIAGREQNRFSASLKYTLQQ